MDFLLSGAVGLVQNSTRVWLEGNNFKLLAFRNWDSDIEQVCKLWNSKSPSLQGKIAWNDTPFESNWTRETT